jgi:tRNA pseudouridine55 synthase
LTSESGLLLIDKPEGWTSHDVVAKARGLVGTRKIGHAGTLDPMATGLLVLGVNSATKLLTFIVGATKTYETTIRLGANTVTDDREGDYLEFADSARLSGLTDAEISSGVAKLTGRIMQVPSSVSAIKVNGERAYAKVRGGDQVKLAAREVEVSRFQPVGELRRVEVDGHHFVDLDAVIDCSSGTYVRALARDLGGSLGVGGHLTALRRTRVGNYSVRQALTLASVKKGEVALLSSADAARSQFAIRELSAAEEIDLRHGKRISIGDIADSERSDEIAAFSADGRLVAMLTRSGKQLKSLVVFAEQELSN